MIAILVSSIQPRWWGWIPALCALLIALWVAWEYISDDEKREWIQGKFKW